MGRRSEGANSGVLFEALEPRLLLDGNVTAKVVKGSLKVTGDGADNRINIEAGPSSGVFIVSRDDGTTTVNGGVADTLTGVTKHVKISMKGGNDQVTIDNVDVPRKLIAKTGLGNDKLTISHVDVDRKATMNTGWGDDTITLDCADFRGKATMNTRAGEDTVTIDFVDFRRSARIQTGAGRDQVSIEGTDFYGWTRLAMGGNRDRLDIDGATFRAWLSVGLGSGNDYLWVRDCSAWKGCLVDAGSGWDTFEEGGGNTGSGYDKWINFENSV